MKALGPEQGVFVRVGSTNRRADAAMLGELRRYARSQSFDEEPMPELDSEAIDFRVASELFAEVRRLRREDLRTLQTTGAWSCFRVRRKSATFKPVRTIRDWWPRAALRELRRS